MLMEAHSRTRLSREVPVNSFLLCTVLARRTRRLARLMPDRGIPELITMALKNCADYEVALELGPGVPDVVRDRRCRSAGSRGGQNRWLGRSLGIRKEVGFEMPFRPLRKLREIASPQVKHRFLAKVRWALAFLWAAASMLLIFVAIYLAFKGNTQ